MVQSAELVMGNTVHTRISFVCIYLFIHYLFVCFCFLVIGKKCTLPFKLKRNDFNQNKTEVSSEKNIQPRICNVRSVLAQTSD